MTTPTARAAARRALAGRLDRPILVLGSGLRDRNLPGYGLLWRQDSTMLYLVGDPGPGCAAIIQPDGATTVYAPPAHPDAALWEGEPPTPDALRARLGVDAVAAIDTLAAAAHAAQPAVVPCADPAWNAHAAAWLGRDVAFGVPPVDAGDVALTDALIAMRRAKRPDELAAMRRAAAATVDAHRLTMALTRPGIREASLHVAFQAALSARGLTEGYATILTQEGEVLHHHGHGLTCEAGRLLLCDGGGEEVTSGYGADVTRTWPVSGRFTPRQRAAYDAVHAAWQAAIDACRAGVRYRAVHDAACLALATWLRDEGLVRTASAEEAVARGAHAVFFPHGVGHLLGLDVHDLEAFGDRAAYPPGQARDPLFGTRNLRLDLPLEADWVVTIEPGFYVVPSILGDRTLRDTLGDAVDWDAAAAWVGFGGIRIEDDVVVRDGAPPEILTDALPRDADAVEACVGTGATLHDILAA